MANRDALSSGPREGQGPSQVSSIPHWHTVTDRTRSFRTNSQLLPHVLISDVYGLQQPHAAQPALTASKVTLSTKESESTPMSWTPETWQGVTTGGGS